MEAGRQMSAVVIQLKGSGARTRVGEVVRRLGVHFEGRTGKFADRLDAAHEREGQR